MARPVLLLVLLAVALAPVLAANDSLSVASTTLDIFFVNDLRYQLFPTTSQSSEELCKGDVKTCFGGLPGLNDLRAKQKDAVWLHAGLGLGHAAGATDYYRLLKHGAGVEAINTLAFNAMSVDADMFRFGKGAEVVAKLSAKTKLTCANCEKGLTGAELQAFQRFTPTGSSCDVVVIGVISKNSTLEYLPTAAVTDEVQAVQDAVKKAQAANSAAALYVVVGEMEAATAEQVLALDGVGVVLSSGTVTVGSAVVSKVSDKKDKVTSTVPEEAALAMSVGQLSLTLDDKCTPTNVQPAATQTYRNGLTKTDPTVAKMVQDVLTEVTETVKLNVASSRELSGDLDPCGFMMCAVGQMAADGVHALLDVATETESTAVIIPAGAFQGKLPTAFNWTTLLGIAPNDPFFCRNSISGELLYALLVDMLAAQTTFPQVSGILIDIWPGDNGVDVVNVWTRSAGLSAQLVPKDATVNVTVAMPCLAMQSSARFVEDAEVTSVVLSEGMRRSLVPAATSTAPSTLALPPLMEARIRLQVPTATRLGCEDWVGMTVTYTLLVLGGIAMVAFQGYQLWRFRTTLSYIR